MKDTNKQVLSPLTKLFLRLGVGFMAGMLLIFLFAKLAEGLLYNELETFDLAVGNYVRSFANGGLTRVAIFVTTLGSAAVEISLFLIVGWFLYFRLKHTWEPVILAVTLAGCWVLNEVLKAFFQRSRPDIEHLVEAGGYSFPSGHAMISAAFYGMLGYLLWLNLRDHSRPLWYVWPLALLLVFSIGLSRIYLGVHFPSDVIGGFAAGGAWLIACIMGLEGIRYYKGREQM